ncbi:MAG: aspartyl protease family protein [Candidatus Aenigmatarchaeota archaeon]
MNAKYKLKHDHIEDSEGNFSDAFRPMVPVTILGDDPENGSDTFAIIDSGSDGCVLSRDLAEIIGIKVEGKKQYDLDGLGGKGFVKAIKTDITVLIRYDRDKFHSVFARRKIQVNVPVDSNLCDQTLILGRSPIFNIFDVFFCCRNDYFELRKLTRD